MTAHKVTLLPGDGIGPEISAATVRVLEATGVKFDWEIEIIGQEAMDKYGSPLPDKVLDSIRKNKVAIKGPVTTPIGTGFRSVNVALRKSLDLYACIRPCKTYRGTPVPFDNIDIHIIRENTEDLYAGIEFAKGTEEAREMRRFIKTHAGSTVREDSGFSIKAISESASRRIVQYAFEYARANNRKKISAIHKANILKYSDGLFLSAAREVAKNYPDIEFEDVLADAICMHLVRTPEIFDVLVLPNLYGDIVSDLCAGLVGGLGLAPGANIGTDIALFEPSHGSAPRYAGLNKLNPMAMMLSGVMMLRYLKEQAAADRLEQAIADVIAEGRDVTYDIQSDKNRPAASTSGAADAVISKLLL